MEQETDRVKNKPKGIIYTLMFSGALLAATLNYTKKNNAEIAGLFSGENIRSQISKISSIKKSILEFTHQVKTFGRENIVDGFFVQVLYLYYDLSKGHFKKESPYHEHAHENLSLLYKKNLIIISSLCLPLVFIPIPGTAELGLMLYYQLIKQLPEQLRSQLWLSFQKSRNMTIPEILRDIPKPNIKKIRRSQFKKPTYQNLTKRSSRRKQ